MQKNNENKSLQDLEGEIWKDIDGYEGLYKISNLGRVKSLLKVLNSRNSIRIINEKILKVSKASGYLSLILTNNYKHKRVLIHRLIGMSFIPNNEGKKIVNHIDGNKMNNSIDNLEWVNHRENCSHYKLSKKSTSKYIGVYYRAKKNRFIASIYYNEKTMHLGAFKTEEEAYKARKQFELDNNIINKYS